MTSAAGVPLPGRVAPEFAPRLTGRESQVLELVLERYRNAEIAAMLGISKRTVESHMSALLAKFDAADRSALMRRARTARVAAGSTVRTARPAAERNSVVARAAELRLRGEQLCRRARRHRAVSAQQLRRSHRLIIDASNRIGGVPIPPGRPNLRATHGGGSSSGGRR